ncbi:hypothetical protein AC579_917 [Pseudocercospora musae]|uniref:C2H2-type domain-containing protein n=1 Tax=Pseudocercospora musae TaxID=113226 RepID=A0A139HC81_9PEZI|nr:hypothetical protein AC579_917 [Pseudocercospora musae]KXT00055.1 hypothetical protein AC579_917 [Pseudocercospora musae]
MGYRGYQPSSPASQWLRRQDHDASDSDADAMECCGETGGADTLARQDGSLSLSDVPNADLAIEMASPRTLRSLLRMMVHSQPMCMDLANAYFSQKQSNGTPSRKRKARETCQHCRVEFDPTDIANEQCIYHPGHKQVSQNLAMFESLFPQHGSRAPIDQEAESRVRWTCCQQPSAVMGCVWARHQALAGRHKRS